MEIWKDFPDFEVYYEISSLGNARSKERRYKNNSGRIITKHSKQLKPIIGKNGYIRYGLKKPNDDKVYKVLAHRAVAMAFIPNPNKLEEVGHKDDNRGHNNYTNLYWTNHSDNINKAVKSNRISFDAIRKANSKNIALIKDGSEYRFESLTSAAEFLDRSIGAVSMAKKNRGKCNGYFVIDLDMANTFTNTIESDTHRNSAVSSIEVAICNEKEIIYCNSISSAARKLNRNISSVINALYSGQKCNGYNVYKVY